MLGLRALGVLFGAAALTAASPSFTTTYLFDGLTAPALPARELCSRSGQGCGGGFAPKLNLAVTSFELDRSEYAWGDEAIGEAVLVNRGREPVRIPWSTEPPPCDDEQRQGWSARNGALIVTFSDQSGNTATAIGVMLYFSSPSNPDATIELRQDDAVRFRFPVRLLGSWHPRFTLSPTPSSVAASCVWQQQYARCAHQYSAGSEVNIRLSRRSP